MPIINISVKDKIATAECGATIVCKNSDYVAKFSFDGEWDIYSVKTARFAYNDDVIPIVFSGDECKIPRLPNTLYLQIEVQAGDIKTATPAWVECIQVLDDAYEEIAPPEPNVYEQIMEIINEIDRQLDYLPSEEEIEAIKKVRNDLDTLTRRFEALANSDDETLDQLAEIVAYIKSNKTLIDSITTSKVSVSDIVDNLLSEEAKKPLSARQGKYLGDTVKKIGQELHNRTVAWYPHYNRTATFVENLSISGVNYLNLPIPAELMPQEGELFEVVRDGFSYPFKLVKYEYDSGMTYLVPDILLDDEGNPILGDWSVMIWIEGNSATISNNTDDGKHIFSIYKIDYAEKLPEGFLPIDTKSNIENGEGESSVQIKGGNAQGNHSADFSQNVSISGIGEPYTTEYLQANFSNDLSDEEKQRLFPVKRVAYKSFKSHADDIRDIKVITFGDGSYVMPLYYGYEWVYFSASGERLIALGDDPSDDTENLYYDVNTWIKSIEVYSAIGLDPSIGDYATFNIFDDIISVYDEKVERTGALADNTFTAGKGTKATKEGQTALGEFNETDDDALIMVGNGTEETPSNAFVVKKDGEVYAGERAERRLLFADELGDISTALDELHAYAQNLVSGVSE